MSNQSVQTVSTSSDKLKLVLAVCTAITGIVFFYFLSDKSTSIRAVALVAGLVLSVGILWTSSLGKTFVNFSKESVRETKKVVWPTRKEAAQITAVVFGFVLVMAIFLWGTDKLLEYVLYDLILSWK